MNVVTLPDILIFTLNVFFKILKLLGVHKYDEEVYDEVMEVFDALPLAATINYMFCVHGGISPKLVNIKEINSIDRFVEVPSIGPMW
jgi:diadenosine tetraphosphatase ApaH/serine/threonine PP2A family protein phosphatase